jgi:hypothetical protein
MSLNELGIDPGRILMVMYVSSARKCDSRTDGIGGIERCGL